MDNTVKMDGKYAFIKKPQVWATAVVVVLLAILLITKDSWRSSLSGTQNTDLTGAVALSLTQNFENRALGLSLLMPTDWTVPVDSAQNGVILLQSADKRLSVEFIKGVCYKASALVTCVNGFQITLGLPQNDEAAVEDEALLSSIVKSAKFGL